MYQNDCDGIRGEIVELMPALRAFSRTFCKTQTDADDLVQETVVKALANLHHFTEGTRLKSWLFTIMRNTFCSRFRVAQREAPGASECVSGNGVTPPPQEWSVMARDMQRAVGNLPSCYRDALEYVILDGKSYEEAAQHFDCAVGTIKSRINRARQHLSAEFGDYN